VVCTGVHEGREVLGIRLTWEKRYITLGPVATILGLAFKLHDPDHLLGGEEDIGITLALIPTSHPGVNIGRRHLPLNASFMNGPNWGKGVFIPMSWVIGGKEYAGQGWRMLMECLAAGRGFAAVSSAGAASWQRAPLAHTAAQPVQDSHRQIRGTKRCWRVSGPIPTRSMRREP
jgi:acyl-CoA dehydrogenase